MIKNDKFVRLFLLFFTCFNVITAEIVSRDKPGSIVLRAEGEEVVYDNITGTQHGVDRSLVDINGKPALLVLSRDSLYFTLAVKGREVLVDCAYFDKRNSLNGARMTAGMCGGDVPLVDTYDDIAQRYSNIWSESIYSFDTRTLLNSGASEKFLLGRIGNIEIFDMYPSASSVENSSPQKFIRSRSGCFNF